MNLRTMTAAKVNRQPDRDGYATMLRGYRSVARLIPELVIRRIHCANPLQSSSNKRGE
jgi:hypothetical protein